MKKINALKKFSIFLFAVMLTATFTVFAAAEEAENEAIFNVTRFGASGDGITDDGAAIQDAFDACNEAGGGTVYFPVGTYCISRTVFFYSNQRILFDDNAILKRTVNEENNAETCGVFLCNWFETSDTNASTSSISCENVEISGGTFDGSGAIPQDSPINVAMINTCHADNVVISDCRFINNYNAHCIEINSSQNVYIRNCEFSDYTGTADNVRYNEMIQIDKSVNSALGSYLDSDVRVLRGYYKETRIDEISPDCKGSSNINITNCMFYGNEYCSAIGNHHSSAYTTVNSGITVADCNFSGGSGERGYITFDSHTMDIEIYNNVFEDGACGITVNRNDAGCVIRDNVFVNCSTAYKGSYSAFGNDIDGTTDADENDPLTGVIKQEEKETAKTLSFFERIVQLFEKIFEMIKALFTF